MKKIITSISICALIFSVSLPSVIYSVSPNLVANPSVESSTNSIPNNWVKESWGKNTSTFDYLDNGQDGNKSLHVKVAGRSSGDAKWVFDPVAVTPNTTYYFSDYYKSTSNSVVIVRFLDSANKETYSELGTQPVSASWKNVNLSFKTTASTVKATVLHLLRVNGELWTDNTYLGTQPNNNPSPTPTPNPTQTPTPTQTPVPTNTPSPTPTNTPKPTPTNTTVPTSVIPTNTPVPTVTSTPLPSGNIPNYSLENSTNNNPTSWTKESWGNSTKLFEYLNIGHTGSKSVQVTLSNYKTGDAKWRYPLENVTAGGYYTFTDWYKSNASTEILLEYQKTDGTVDYMQIRNAPVAANWTKFTASFYIPTGVVKATVLHIIAMNGYLNTDDYSLQPSSPTSFNRPLLTLTFDDGWEENLTSTLPKLNSYGFKTTQFYATKYVEGTGHEHDLDAYLNSGHELGSHSVNHYDMALKTAAVNDYELSHSKQYLQNTFGPNVAINYAAPYGSYTDPLFAQAQQYYRSYRTTDEGYNERDNFDFYNVHVQNMESTTTLQEVKDWIQSAMAKKAWLVIVYHRVANDPEQYDTRPADFDKQLEYINASGITVKTYNQALDEIQAQL